MWKPEAEGRQERIDWRFASAPIRLVHRLSAPGCYAQKPGVLRLLPAHADRTTISRISSSVSATGLAFMLLVALERSTNPGISASVSP